MYNENVQKRYNKLMGYQANHVINRFTKDEREWIQTKMDNWEDILQRQEPEFPDGILYKLIIESIKAEREHNTEEQHG